MKDDNTQETSVFRGRLKDCTAHLFAEIESQAPKGTREAAALRRPIAKFCDIQESSVARWMRGEGGATGEVAFRLICYLELMGYEVIEFVRADTVVRSTIEILGFRIMSGEEIAHEIGYTTASSLFQVLNGHVGLSEEKKNALWNLAKKYRSALEEAKSKGQDALKLVQERQRGHEPKGLPPHRDTSGQRQLAQDMGPPVAGTGQGVIGIMGGLLILLERGTLTEDDCAAFTPQEQRTILKLSGHLSRLSSNLISRDAE